MYPIIEIITADIKFPSPYSHRVQILCHEKNLNYQLVVINPYQKPEWFLKIAPLGQVPVLRLGETIIPDSRAINEYLDTFCEPNLLPFDPLLKAQHRAWIAFADEIAQEITQFIKQKKTAIIDLKRLNQLLSVIEEALQEPYFFGSSISLVDITLVSHLLWLNALEQGFFPFSILQQYPKLYRWFVKMKDRPSVCETAGQDYEKNFMKLLIQRGFINL